MAQVAVVILTTGNRPDELRRAVESALAQRDVGVTVVVVANGVRASSLQLDGRSGIELVESATNLGIPGGRNLGAERAACELIAFLDDDAHFVDAGVLARTADRFGAEPRLGAVALRLVDEHGRTARRHVPRLGGSSAERSGPVAGFLGGACVLRAAAFRDAGRYAGEFRYAMEETDLSLRLVDRGWQIQYDGTPAVFHPATAPSRHADSAFTTMRNRVWLAHRNLPVPLAVLYVANWFTVTTARQPRSLPTLVRALLRGWSTRPGPRRPIRWRSAWRLTRLGRPPVI